ncbi:hypothetical protein T07_7068 [Trichinella nelsoni]|uniref:Uncharacterized protein n=1 Tax=Trichinella nelsoni TaxID=6336 RepID=A0A0V0RAG9_9BILA|nr:hypothetical protein T07_7068 [Trichinella nelsoni]
MLVNWVVNADFYLLASYSLPLAYTPIFYFQQ